MADIEARPKRIKPQKKLLVISSILLIAWIGLLVWMYVSWVWPSRENGTPTPIEKTE